MEAKETQHSISGCVEVLVDGAPAHLGSLSYLTDFPVGLGDAIQIPFGKAVRNGVVIGPGDPAKATRYVMHLWGPRVHPGDIEAYRVVAQQHFSSVAEFSSRLAPRNNKGDDPVDAGPIVCESPIPLPDVANRYILRAPNVAPAEVAAAAATTLATDSGKQILVLCPTKQLVTQTLKLLPSGAARLSDPGAWAGFVAGTVRIGIGTRASAMWSPQEFGGVVVVEEDHPGHFEARSPNTNARTVALHRARYRQVPVCLIGARPTGHGLGANVKVLEVGSMPEVQVTASSRPIAAGAVAAAVRALRTGKTVAVIAPDLSATRRCEKCSDVRPCLDKDCDDPRCSHPMATPLCPRCQTSDTYVVGTDRVAVAEKFPEDVTVLDPFTADHKPRYDVVILLKADSALRRPTFEPESGYIRDVVSAATLVNEDGTLVLAVADKAHPVVVAAKSRSMTNLARLIWKRCQEDKLAPFGVVVKLDIGAARKPNLGKIPGRVLGPMPKGPSSWEVVIHLDTKDLPAFSQHLARLRTAFRMRYQIV